MLGGGGYDYEDVLDVVGGKFGGVFGCVVGVEVDMGWLLKCDGCWRCGCYGSYLVMFVCVGDGVGVFG